MLELSRPPVSNPILNHIITHTPISTDTYTHIPITTHIHTTMVVIMVSTALITTLTAILITVVVLEAEDITVVAGAEEDITVVAEAEEDPTVVAGAEDVEDLDRIRDSFGGEFEPRVSTKQGSTAARTLRHPKICTYYSTIQDNIKTPRLRREMCIIKRKRG